MHESLHQRHRPPLSLEGFRNGIDLTSDVLGHQFFEQIRGVIGLKSHGTNDLFFL